MSVGAPPPAPPWAEKLFTVGVTGTNGKTSTTTAIAALLGELGRPVAHITTLGCFLDEKQLSVAPYYKGFLATMRQGLDLDGRYAAIELTSEALALGFARAWPCRIGVFTNLSHEHSETHGTAEHYLASKAQLFMALPPGGTAVLNARDPNAELIDAVTADGVEILRYGVPSRGELWARPDLAAHSIRVSPQGTSFELEHSERFPELPRTWSIRAIGDVFVENALAALAAALAASVPATAAARVLSSIAPPPGRFELVRVHPYVVVDYAHTPDALSRTLATARALCTGRLTVVFGAGGNSDRTKRPLLGVAARVADHIVLTSDNPRDEDPQAIIAQVAEGIGAHACITREVDRKRAIQLALRDARWDDWVIIAGKGHEQYQEVVGIKTAFSDSAIACETDSSVQ